MKGEEDATLAELDLAHFGSIINIGYLLTPVRRVSISTCPFKMFNTIRFSSIARILEYEEVLEITNVPIQVKPFSFIECLPNSFRGY